MASRRNEPCPCGSGKKYKACCAAAEPRRSNWLATLGLAAFILITGWVVAEVVRATRGERQVPPGYVWSEEHGHLHRIGGTEEQALPGALPPPGAVWSEEHGHYHGSDGREIRWSEQLQTWVDTGGNPV